MAAKKQKVEIPSKEEVKEIMKNMNLELKNLGVQDHKLVLVPKKIPTCPTGQKPVLVIGSNGARYECR